MAVSASPRNLCRNTKDPWRVFPYQYLPLSSIPFCILALSGEYPTVLVTLTIRGWERIHSIYLISIVGIKATTNGTPSSRMT